MLNLDTVIQSFRQDIPETSQTAQAIDRGAGMEEISQLATAESAHLFAAVLFEAEQEEAGGRLDCEIDLQGQIDRQLGELRVDLPAASETAKAIDRDANWEEISINAQKEGMGALAAALFVAEGNIDSPSA